MTSIAEKYQQACLTKSDINEHLPVLLNYALQSEHITEMGVRDVVSTWALLHGMPKKLISYDVNYHPNIGAALAIARNEGIDFEFQQKNVLEIEIEPTDFLFIDTLHTYEQLSKELALHGMKARRFLAFHDTASCARVDDSGYGRGLMPAIEEFMARNPEWAIDAQYDNNHGLLILKRYGNTNSN